jgi:RNA recognition motif-containing protein
MNRMDESRKLYVGNLLWAMSEKELREAFLPFGEVTEVIIVRDKATGKAKGFGFIEMSSPAEARKARDAMDDSTLGGRKITVDFARPRESPR